MNKSNANLTFIKNPQGWAAEEANGTAHTKLDIKAIFSITDVSPQHSVGVSVRGKLLKKPELTSFATTDKVTQEPVTFAGAKMLFSDYRNPSISFFVVCWEKMKEDGSTPCVSELSQLDALDIVEMTSLFCELKRPGLPSWDLANYSNLPYIFKLKPNSIWRKIEKKNIQNE